MRHTLKLIYRNFTKNLAVNLINVGGLTISMTVVLILAAYCYSELSTDLHHDNVDQTYLITNSHELNDMDIATPGVLADHLISNIPEAKKVVRLAGTWSPPVVKHEDGESFETILMFADDGFFDLFSYKPAAGNLEIALKEPMSAVLVSSEAIRLFGTTDVIGKSLTINNQYLVQVTAVVEENPNNSILSFKIVTPVSSIPQMPIIDSDFTSWDNWFFMTFIQLANGADIQKIDGIIDNIFFENAETRFNDRQLESNRIGNISPALHKIERKSTGVKAFKIILVRRVKNDWEIGDRIAHFTVVFICLIHRARIVV